MLDNITLYYNDYEIESNNYDITSLENYTISMDSNNVISKESGKIKNIHVSKKHYDESHHIKIKNSIRKFTKEDYRDLTFSEVQDVVTTLEDKLSFKIDNFNFSSLEFGFTLEVDYQFNEYIRTLVSAPRANINLYADNMICFTYSPNNNRRTGQSLYLYDPTNNIKLNGNYLRVELRIPRRVKDRLKLNSNLLVESLNDKSLWIHMKDILIKKLSEIKCITELSNTNISSKADYYQFMITCSINGYDDYVYHEKILLQNYKNGNLSKNSYYNIKKSIYDYNNRLIVVRDDYKNEIIEKVEDKFLYLINN